MSAYLVIDNMVDDEYNKETYPCNDKLDETSIESYENTNYNNVFECINIGDIVYNNPGTILGKCFYKSTDGSQTICLENKKLAIWIKGKCFKTKNGWMFIEGELKAFYKDCCP